MNNPTKRTLTLQVAGKTYRVATTASEAELERLAGLVDERTRELFRGRTPGADALVLTAISLAHDAEQERQATTEFKSEVRAHMSALLEEIDAALAQLAEPSTPAAKA